MHTVLKASSSSVKADHVLLMRTCSCLRQPTCASTRISPRQGHVVSKRSTSSESHRPPQVIEGFESFQDVEGELRRRKAKSDFKKRKSQTFVDKAIVTLKAGSGGPGCVSFHREKFRPYGGPSGGNGGKGGSIYIQAVPNLSTLNAYSGGKKVKGGQGASGSGGWMHGKNAEDVVMRVPVGTVVREIRVEEEDEWGGMNEEARWEEYDDLAAMARSAAERVIEEAERSAPEDRLEGRGKKGKRRGAVQASEGHEEVDEAEDVEDHSYDLEVPDSSASSSGALLDDEAESRLKELREALFVYHPSSTLIPAPHPSTTHFLSVEAGLISKRRLLLQSTQGRPPIEMDLSTPTPEGEPILLVEGGEGGHGNPFFAGGENNIPRFATKGREGETLRLELELKSLADVGLVGFPNAGKSTLLRAITNSKAEVAPYAFTTLNPQIGTVIVYSDGSFDSELESQSAIEDSTPPTTHFSGDTGSPTPDPPLHGRRSGGRRTEMHRFTVADCPGLLPDASLNVGLGHSFLRHIERSKILVYVIDFSNPDPWIQLRTLQKELSDYKSGMNGRCKIVIANKADLIVQGEEGKRRLEELKQHVLDMEDWEVRNGVRSLGPRGTGKIRVVPVSAKLRLNVAKIVEMLGEELGDSEAEDL